VDYGNYIAMHVTCVTSSYSFPPLFFGKAVDKIKQDRCTTEIPGKLHVLCGGKIDNDSSDERQQEKEHKDVSDFRIHN
jgi:hypothetical protein